MTIFSMAEMSVRGCGNKKGIVIGEMHYDKLPKELLMIICKDSDVKKTVIIIIKKGVPEI